MGKIIRLSVHILAVSASTTSGVELRLDAISLADIEVRLPRLVLGEHGGGGGADEKVTWRECVNIRRVIGEWGQWARIKHGFYL